MAPGTFFSNFLHQKLTTPRNFKSREPSLCVVVASSVIVATSARDAGSRGSWAMLAWIATNVLSMCVPETYLLNRASVDSNNEAKQLLTVLYMYRTVCTVRNQARRSNVWGPSCPRHGMRKPPCAVRLCPFSSFFLDGRFSHSASQASQRAQPSNQTQAVDQNIHRRAWPPSRASVDCSNRTSRKTAVELQELQKRFFADATRSDIATLRESCKMRPSAFVGGVDLHAAL